jgi:hypothetical protein
MSNAITAWRVYTGAFAILVAALLLSECWIKPWLMRCDVQCSAQCLPYEPRAIATDPPVASQK